MKFKILLLLFLICIVSVLFGYLYICYSIEHFDTTPVLPLKAYYINLENL